MNRDVNKAKRRDFLRRLVDVKSNGCSIFYVDETNFNLWIARTRGRSRVGERCIEQRVASGGSNRHLSACISASGLIYYETRFGANRAENVCDFIATVLCTIRDSDHAPLHKTVLVLDNTPCHTDVESVFDREEFAGARLLRLGYSPQLNPIESVFSVLKFKIKANFAREIANMQSVPVGTTMTAHRRSYLQRATDTYIVQAASASNCAAFEAHTLRFNESVFFLQDIPVGL